MSRAALKRLALLRAQYGGDASADKLALLDAIDGAQLSSAKQVAELHEVLCFLRAYPDDAAVLERVETMLAGFSKRADLRRHRRELEGTGIAGTEIPFPFYFATARWLAARWPGRLFVDWTVKDGAGALRTVLPTLVSRAEAIAFRESKEPVRSLVDRMRGPGEPDGACLVRHFDALGVDPALREAMHDAIDTAYLLKAGERPSRTNAYFDAGPTVFQRTAPSRKRPDLKRALRRAPKKTQFVSEKVGATLIDLAREAMVTRARDLDAFAYGNPADVSLTDDGDGLSFALIGSLPERRHLLRGAYGALMMKNGVPLGYIQLDVALGHAEVSFNVFETFRGAEAGRLFARTLAVAHHVLGVRSFSIEPYQLGHHNREAIDSGAWWFYYKFGFRPLEKELLALARAEVESGQRSTKATLRTLATKHVYFGPASGPPPYLRINEALSQMISERFGGDRDAAARRAPKLALKRLGLKTFGAKTPDERLAVERLSPLILLLDGLEDWPIADRRAVATLVRAKGAKRESVFLTKLATLYRSSSVFSTALMRIRASSSSPHNNDFESSVDSSAQR